MANKPFLTYLWRRGVAPRVRKSENDSNHPSTHLSKKEGSMPEESIFCVGLIFPPTKLRPNFWFRRIIELASSVFGRKEEEKTFFSFFGWNKKIVKVDWKVAAT